MPNNSTDVPASAMNHALKAGVFYFALVFAAGFVLGTIRTVARTASH